jgi:hypothetical protein
VVILRVLVGVRAGRGRESLQTPSTVPGANRHDMTFEVEEAADRPSEGSIRNHDGRHQNVGTRRPPVPSRPTRAGDTGRPALQQHQGGTAQQTMNPVFLGPHSSRPDGISPHSSRPDGISSTTEPPPLGYIFRSVDVDGSGSISFGELARWWGRRQMAITKTLDEDTLRELKSLWDQADADGSGELDHGEFEVVMERLARSDWVETSDPQTGRTYFYNRKTKETRWEEPETQEMVDKFLVEQSIQIGSTL